MDPKTILESAQDAMSARSVYAEPYTEGGTTILPVAAVRGGGGGGGDERANGGGGFGLSARPVGAYVIRDGAVQWKAAIDYERVAIAGFLVTGAAVLAIFSITSRRR
jgi:uncharacterized spore protein YtfJ